MVSGSDLHLDPHSNPAVARLLAGGAILYREHRAENLSPDVSLVIASAAIGSDNPEILAARERGIRIVSRADFLGELMAAHKGPKIAIAGTHGKTTTTGMIGVMLQHAGLDPTVFVGGEVAQLGGNVRIGKQEGPFVAEACEAYSSFLSLNPDIIVLTNIEAEHLDHYGTPENVLKGYQRFLENLRPLIGEIVINADDLNTLEVLGGINFPYLLHTFGMGHDAQFRAAHITEEGRTAFDWISPTGQAHITLKVPGRHNVMNALAAATVGRLLEIPEADIAAGLSAFRGAGRRQEILGEIPFADGSILVMDDYAHHPTEIRATLDALRSAYPRRRLVPVFQPHLYSRTRDFLPEFAKVLSEANVLLVTDIYAAREAPLPGVHAADIAQKAGVLHPQAKALYLPEKRDIPEMLAALVCPGDLVVFLGAGDIRDEGEAFVQLLQERSAKG